MDEIWITGIGILSPLGIGKEAVKDSLREHRSGVGRVTLFDIGDFPVQVGAEVKGFNARSYVKNRKALKVSRRNIHLALSAGRLAWEDAGFAPENGLNPERAGIVMSAGRITGDMEEICPLVRESLNEDGSLNLAAYAENAPTYLPPYWFLRHIPNMVPAHISIELQLKGPSDTNCMTVVGGLLSLEEAAEIIRRGDADVMFAGGADTFMEPYHYITHYQLNRLDPRDTLAPTPFDKNSQGTVLGESSTVLVLERSGHAERRGRQPYAIFDHFESGKFVKVQRDYDSMILRNPEVYREGSVVTALSGTGIPKLDRVEIELANSEGFTCYRQGSGWLGGTGGPHDLVCLILESEMGTVGEAFPVQDPIDDTSDKWHSREISSGDRVTVQSLSWNGQFASLTVRIP